MKDDCELEELERKLKQLTEEEVALDKSLDTKIPLNDEFEWVKLDARGPNNYFTQSALNPMKGDIRGIKRAVLIRRVGAVIALTIAVVAAVSISVTENVDSVSLRPSLLQRRFDELDSSSLVVPKALEAVGNSLSPSEKVLFENRYQDLLGAERRHEEWDQQQASHLVEQITLAANHNTRQAEERRITDEAIAKHREDLAQRKAIRMQRLISDSERRQNEEQSDAYEHQEVLSDIHGQNEHDENKKMSHEVLARIQRIQKERKFLAERSHRAASWQQRQQAIELARKVYEEARKRAVEAKDALKDSLSERDRLTEQLRSVPYDMQSLAEQHLHTFEDKVDKLMLRVESTKKAWHAAQHHWFQLQHAGTWPTFPAPPPTAHTTPVAAGSAETVSEAPAAHEEAAPAAKAGPSVHLVAAEAALAAAPAAPRVHRAAVAARAAQRLRQKHQALARGPPAANPAHASAAATVAVAVEKAEAGRTGST